MRWISVAGTDGKHDLTTVTGTRGALTEFEVGDAESTGEPVGTAVIIENVEQEPAGALLAEDAGDKLTAMLAPYLERYPNVSVAYRGAKLDPAKLQAHRAEYDIGLPENPYGP